LAPTSRGTDPRVRMIVARTKGLPPSSNSSARSQRFSITAILLNVTGEINGTIAAPPPLPYSWTVRVRFFSQESVAPALSLATDRFFLQNARRSAQAVLRVYGFPGDVLLIGRYHAWEGVPEVDHVVVSRRLSGGRVVPAGQGFVQFALVVPHRSAFFSD